MRKPEPNIEQLTKAIWSSSVASALEEGAYDDADPPTWDGVTPSSRTYNERIARAVLSDLDLQGFMVIPWTDVEALFVSVMDEDRMWACDKTHPVWEVLQRLDEIFKTRWRHIRLASDGPGRWREGRRRPTRE